MAPPSALSRQAEVGFAELGGDGYQQLAEECRAYGTVVADSRYFVLSDCLAASSAFWSPGETGAVDTAFAASLAAVWDARLGSVLAEPDTEIATALARAIRDEIQSLAAARPPLG